MLQSRSTSHTPMQERSSLGHGGGTDIKRGGRLVMIQKALHPGCLQIITPVDGATQHHSLKAMLMLSNGPVFWAHLHYSNTVKDKMLMGGGNRYCNKYYFDSIFKGQCLQKTLFCKAYNFSFGIFFFPALLFCTGRNTTGCLRPPDAAYRKEPMFFKILSTYPPPHRHSHFKSNF